MKETVHRILTCVITSVALEGVDIVIVLLLNFYPKNKKVENILICYLKAVSWYRAQKSAMLGFAGTVVV